MASLKSKRKPPKEQKMYDVYHFDYYDESIEESNVAFSVLTERTKIEANKKNKDCWFSRSSKMTLKQILRYSWDTEDIDRFVEENPECSDSEFYTDGYSEEKRKYMTIKYKPLFAIRDKKINDILG